MKEQLKKAIAGFNKGRVLVVGDVVIDEMIYGNTARISREAPVLILNHDETHIILGAAGNAAHNIAKLNAQQVSTACVAGKDYYCSLLLDALQRDGVNTDYLVQDEKRPTSTKTRISGIANHSVTQQIVRVDKESDAPIGGKLEKTLLDHISEAAKNVDAILLSDYGLGVLTPKVIDHACALAKEHNLVLTVDSQRDLSLFNNATVVTPNQPEAEKNVGFAITDHDSLLKAGKTLLANTQAKNILLTRGAEGMCLFERDGNVTHIPAFNRSEVFDVTGAGDTVVGTLTLALATGADLTTATILGNLAASIVVKRFGAATTTIKEIETALADIEADVLDNILKNRDVLV